MNLASKRCFAKLESAKSFLQCKFVAIQQIHQTLLLPKSYCGKFTKVSSHQTFQLYETFQLYHLVNNIRQAFLAGSLEVITMWLLTWLVTDLLTLNTFTIQ